jgi:colicin import membrane protein
LQSRAFRRLLGWSLAGHLIVYLSLIIHPFRSTDLIAATPVMVQMVEMPKAAVPKPAPARPAPPKPKPPEEKKVEPPAPPKPVVKEIVIPKEPAPLAKPKPKSTAPPPSAEELLAKMTERVEAQEAAKAPAEEPAQAEEATAAAEYSPGRFDPILSPWLASVKTRVRANWSGASVCKGASQFDVDVDAGGQLTNISLAQSSGDRYCDDTVERALRKSNPLPPPPHAMSFVFAFDPKDMQ